MKRQIIITDVTEMGGTTQFCIAGWDPQANCMVRPLSSISRHWGAHTIAANLLAPGNVFEIDVAGSTNTGSYPHLTEDLVTTGRGNCFQASSDWITSIATSASSTVSAAFDGHLVSKTWNGHRYSVHVPSGTKCRSLGAIILPAGQLEFVGEAMANKQGRQVVKLRAYVTDSQSTYKLPVVAHNLCEAYRAGGLAQLNALAADGSMHVRLGLARAFADKPSECFVMVNGVYRC